MSHALTRRLQRLEHQARACLDADPPPTPEEQAAAAEQLARLLGITVQELLPVEANPLAALRLTTHRPRCS